MAEERVQRRLAAILVAALRRRRETAAASSGRVHRRAGPRHGGRTFAPPEEVYAALIYFRLHGLRTVEAGQPVVRR